MHEKGVAVYEQNAARRAERRAERLAAEAEEGSYEEEDPDELDEDFEDDTKDAGDIGSGQQVTVLYEIVPNNGNEKSLKYQDNESKAETNELSGEMLTVSVRYKDPEASESKLIDKSVMCSDYTEAVSQNFAKACSAAEFAMVLRNSDYASGLTAQGVVDYMEQNNVDNSELFELIYKYMQNGTGSEASYW